MHVNGNNAGKEVKCDFQLCASDVDDDVVDDADDNNNIIERREKKSDDVAATPMQRQQ